MSVLDYLLAPGKDPLTPPMYFGVQVEFVKGKEKSFKWLSLRTC